MFFPPDNINQVQDEIQDEIQDDIQDENDDYHSSDENGCCCNESIKCQYESSSDEVEQLLTKHHCDSSVIVSVEANCATACVTNSERDSHVETVSMTCVDLDENPFNTILKDNGYLMNGSSLSS